MCLGIGPMGGQIGGHGVEFVFEAVHWPVEPGFRLVDLVRQHPVPFDQDVQFLLIELGLDPDLMAELGHYFLFKVKDDLFEALEVLIGHVRNHL